MSNITNLIGDYESMNVPGKKHIRKHRADSAMAEFENIVGERDQALKDLEEARVSIAFLENTLAFHNRAAKLMVKRKPFVVVARDEPYYMQVYALIREHEMKIGRWSEEDERNYQAAEQSMKQTAGTFPLLSDDPRRPFA